jgi:hypothetical protein
MSGGSAGISLGFASNATYAAGGPTNNSGTNAAANTGNGGANCVLNTGPPGNGGSGIVIIRWAV